MALQQDITTVNNYADLIATFKRGTFNPRTPAERQLRQDALTIIEATMAWPTIETRDGQHLVLQAPDGTQVLYSYEEEGEQFVERLTELP